ncbi:MAG: arginine deiminase-related protein [Pseudomonadota bacterium]
MAWPQTMLMVNPEHFDVVYGINPHMVDQKGELNKVDHDLAKSQWEALKTSFEKSGMNVDVLPGQSDLPDMVFCANQTFPFEKEGQRHLILSNMQSEKRQPEVPFFEKWAKDKGYITHTVETPLFEGMGDLLWNYETKALYGGYGFRTSPEVYSEIEKIVGQRIVTLELTSEHFYHLDTCLSILNGKTAAYVKEAFTEEGLNTLKSEFNHLIEVPISEATNQLACNMCTPNGQDVIIQKGASETNRQLMAHGFNVIEVETSEYIKSGGSVFCMKQLLF